MLVLPSRRGAPPIITQVRDPDARAFIQRVQAADGQELGRTLWGAIDRFVIGCKADGTWSAIKASCIMAGARTLAGALTPLVGPAPTNVNFVSGDYSRTLGLLGNGSTKYLEANRNGNSDPQNSHHMAVRASAIVAANFIGSVTGFDASGANTFSTTSARSRAQTSVAYPDAMSGPGFIGISRSGSAAYTVCVNGASSDVTQASQAPNNASLTVFRTSGTHAAHRLQFYSIGESLDLALLDARVTTLMADIAAALP
jgi:hypothetical protein